MISVFLPIGHSLTITSPEDSAGTYTRLGNPGGTRYTPAELAAASDVTIGPFNEERNYLLVAAAGLLTYAINPAAASVPSPVSIGGIDVTASGTELNYVDGVTSAIQTQLNLKAPLASPTFTGTAVLPATTSIGTVTNTEIGYLDNVTSAIQTQLDAKQATLSAAALTAATIAVDDKVLIQDTSATDALKTVTTQAVADLSLGRLKSFQIFTTGTAATYTRPAGVSSVLVEVVGGGGGGGGVAATASSVSAAGGGGAGAYAKLYVATADATYTYSVGAGGAGGTAGANNGSAGGSSSFSAASLEAQGGAGGIGTSGFLAVASGFTAGGAGGAGLNGDVNIPGEAGDPGVAILATAMGGRGGSSQWGKGAAPVIAPGAGTNAPVYGVGGGGGNTGDATDRAGGNGSPGLIVVWEFS